MTTTTSAPGSNACFPGSDVDYPPTGNGVAIQAQLRLGGGFFHPGGSGRVILLGAAANAVLCGRAFSTPIILPAKRADASGQVVYDLAVPKDFELNAEHHIDVYQLQKQVGSFDFCVNKSGDITALGTCGKKASTSAPLARTGASNHTDEIAKAGIVLVGAGAAALYARRRRERSAARA